MAIARVFFFLGMHLRRAGEVLKLVEQIKSDNKEK